MEKPPDPVTTKSPVKTVSMVLENDALVEAAKMVMNPTRPTPIMRAEAVVAVRCGLLIAFSRARRPVMPSSRESGQPMVRLSGRATVGALGDVGEQVVERPAHGVGQHQRPGHEGHAEHHSQSGGDEPQLVGEEVADGGVPHG